MKSLALLAVAGTLGFIQSTVQDAAKATPQACVKAGRDFAANRQREIVTLTSDDIRKIDAERIEMVRACAASFDIEKTAPADLSALIELYTESQQPDRAERAIERAVSANTSPADRASALTQAIRFLLRQPKSEARNARAEEYMTALDGFPDDQLEQKLTAHVALNAYYRGDDIDAGIIRHSTWLIDAGRRLTTEQRKRFGFPLTAAYLYLAEAVAGQGDTDRALDLLTRAPKELSDVPYVEKRTSRELARYRLVGTPAPAIGAQVWLNAPEGTRTLRMDGAVTLLQFTAHWCGPCRESYPGLQRLRKRFAGQPFRVVFATQLYGYFDKDRDLTAAQEIERDRVYFRDLGLDVPVAIAARPGDAASANGPDNDAAYRVDGIPQINIIDARGRIRLIMIGYDVANEPRLEEFIGKLLAEKSGASGQSFLQQRDLTGVIRVVLYDSVQQDVVRHAGSERTIAWIVRRLQQLPFGQRADRSHELVVRAIESLNGPVP
jgi:cytochrome c biogenesis protein CcmG/thiol:disulfide interchange protein DsbE